MRDCTECTFLNGDECYLYTGPTVLSCDLVTNTWYKIDDLIAAQQCAYGPYITTSTTTTTTTTEEPVLQIVATFADIDQSGTPRFIQVTTDETNDGETTLYWWDGEQLNWIPSQDV